MEPTHSNHDSAGEESAQAMENSLVFRSDIMKIGAPFDQKTFEIGETLFVLGTFETQLKQLYNDRDLRFAPGSVEQFSSLAEMMDCWRSFNVLINPNKVVCSLPQLPNDWMNNPAHEFLKNEYCLHLVKVEFKASTELVQTMPFFRRLDKNDQVCLLNYTGTAISLLNQVYYSSKKAIPFATRASGFCNYLVLKHSYGDPIIKSCADRLFRLAGDKMRRMQLQSAEFLLLRALIAMHSATTGLSLHAQQIIQEEAERMAAMLMHYLQSRFGHFGAVKRYAELLSLVECAFHNAHKNRECVNYMEMLHSAHFAWIREQMAPAFVPMMWHGCEF